MSDSTTLAPEGPIDGDWDEHGKEFSAPDEGSEAAGDFPPGINEARVEALNDALRPLDRCERKAGARRRGAQVAD